MPHRHRHPANHRPWVKPIIIGVIILVSLSGIFVSNWLSNGPRRPAPVETTSATDNGAPPAVTAEATTPTGVATALLMPQRW